MGKKEVTLYICDRCGHKWEELPGRPKYQKEINGYYMVDITFTGTDNDPITGAIRKMRTSAYWCVECATRLMELLDDEGYLWDIVKGSEDEREK